MDFADRSRCAGISSGPGERGNQIERDHAPPRPEVVGKLQEKGVGSTLLDRQAAGMAQTDPVPVMTSEMLVSSLSYALRRELTFPRSAIPVTGSFLHVPTLESLI